MNHLDKAAALLIPNAEEGEGECIIRVNMSQVEERCLLECYAVWLL
jgi:hypothetical protein